MCGILRFVKNFKRMGSRTIESVRMEYVTHNGALVGDEAGGGGGAGDSYSIVGVAECV